MNAPTRKNNASRIIPEDIQAPMRRRLELARRYARLHKIGVRTLSASALKNYEQHDISPLKLGDLMTLAGEYGYEPLAFITYLLGNEDVALLAREQNRNVESASVYMRQLPEAMQELAIMLLRTLADFGYRNEDDNDIRRIIQASPRPIAQANSQRDRLRAALLAAENQQDGSGN